MKKLLTKVALLSVSFLLASCGAENSSSSVTPPDSDSDSSSLVPGSDSGSSSATPSEDPSSASWSESDLAAMAKYLNGYKGLPFPTGISSSYVEASGTDEDEECFIVYDTTCGDLTSEYGKQLLAADFEYDEEDSDSEENYYFYYYSLEDSNDEIWVQVDYIDGYFDIFAWVEEGVVSYKAFPYEVVAEVLSIDETLDETKIPSFPLAANEEYYVLADEVGGSYVMVYGYYDTTIAEETYTSDYEAKLTTAGYTVDSEDGTAINATIGLEIEYMAYEGMFAIQIEKYSEADPIVPGDHAIEFSADDFPTSYGSFDFEKDGFKFSGESIMQINGCIQFRNAKKGSGILYNTTAISNLTSIVITATSADYYGILSLYVSSSMVDASNPGTAITPTVDGTSCVYTYAISEGYSYFKLIDEAQNASKNSSIVINYNAA